MSKLYNILVYEVTNLMVKTFKKTGTYYCSLKPNFILHSVIFANYFYPSFWQYLVNSVTTITLTLLLSRRGQLFGNLRE